MIRRIFTGLLTLALSSTFAQNNGIYNGGYGDGADCSEQHGLVNHNIFSGGQGDGYHLLHSAEQTNSPIVNGGPGDGYSESTITTQQNHSIFTGGPNDGYDHATSGNQLNNPIYSGNEGDGYANDIGSSASTNIAFNGGEGDGYSYKLDSRLIWQGGISSDWLVAGNWLPNRVPSLYDDVLILRGLVYRPKLNGKLVINSIEQYKYACHSLEIDELGSLTISTGYFINKGLIDIYGGVNLLGNLRSENLDGGIITVQPGGRLTIF